MVECGWDNDNDDDDTDADDEEDINNNEAKDGEISCTECTVVRSALRKSRKEKAVNSRNNLEY